MQKISGNGIVFLEIDGSSLTYELAPGEKNIKYRVSCIYG